MGDWGGARGVNHTGTSEVACKCNEVKVRPWKTLKGKIRRWCWILEWMGSLRSKEGHE